MTASLDMQRRRRSAHRLWLRTLGPRHRRFVAGLGHAAAVQREVLLACVRRNAATEYGRRHGFRTVRSVAEYRRRVPLTAYEDYRPYVARIRAGAPGVLTSEPVTLLEPTSGTASGTKWIPYTPALREEFLRGLGAWLAALYRQWPDLGGRAVYWSISPALPRAAPVGPVRAGFERDADYLDPVGRRAHNLAAAVPDSVRLERDLHAFRNLTLAHLAAAPDLGLVSVWSPTFLSVLLDHLASHGAEVAATLEGLRLPHAAGQAARLRAVLRRCRDGQPWRQLWPGWRVLSCWADGPSRVYAANLCSRLDGPALQPKGLLATEALVSFPLLHGRDPVLAVGSHFFEFEDPERGDLLLAHELVRDRVYSVIVTTGGGLYRYRLGDRVAVTGFLAGVPLLRFVGRQGLVSDLCGEKLHAEHVQQVVERGCEHAGLRPGFFLLAPSRTGRVPAYALFMGGAEMDEAQAAGLRSAVERGLARNVHYACCRRLGQLAPLRLFLVDPAGPDPAAAVLERLWRRGRVLGDIKPPILDWGTGWERCFRGRFLGEPPAAPARAAVAQRGRRRE